MIPLEEAEAWRIKLGYKSMADINTGGCDIFAIQFMDKFPTCIVVGTDDFISWDHGAWPGGHVWIQHEGRHYDSEALDGVDHWRELPFFKRSMRNLKTVTWLSKDWMSVDKRKVAVISIGDPGEDIPSFASDPIDLLRLEFHDIPNSVSIDDLDSTYRQVDWHDARKILEFEHRYRDHDIIVHCHAGQSRSSAVAIYLSQHCNRSLDIASPCIGRTELQNTHVAWQLKRTHLDMLTTKAQVTTPRAKL